MNKKRTLIGIAAVAFLAILVYFYGGHRAPPGQAALTSLTTENIPDLKKAFNTAQGQVRVLLLLSPT